MLYKCCLMFQISVTSQSGCQEIADEFRAQEIDGQAMLLLKEDHLMSAMNIKLGPALKIFARINMLKDSKPWKGSECVCLCVLWCHRPWPSDYSTPTALQHFLKNNEITLYILGLKPKTAPPQEKNWNMEQKMTRLPMKNRTMVTQTKWKAL